MELIVWEASGKKGDSKMVVSSSAEVRFSSSVFAAFGSVLATAQGFSSSILLFSA